MVLVHNTLKRLLDRGEISKVSDDPVMYRRESPVVRALKTDLPPTYGAAGLRSALLKVKKEEK